MNETCCSLRFGVYKTGFIWQSELDSFLFMLMFLLVQSTKTHWNCLGWDKKFTQLTLLRPELSAPSPQLVSLSLKKPGYQRPNPSQLQQRLLKGSHHPKPAGPVSTARFAFVSGLYSWWCRHQAFAWPEKPIFHSYSLGNKGSSPRSCHPPRAKSLAPRGDERLTSQRCCVFLTAPACTFSGGRRTPWKGPIQVPCWILCAAQMP